MNSNSVHVNKKVVCAAAALLLFFIIVVSIMWPRQAVEWREVLADHGQPLFVAESISIELWDPDSRALIKSRQLVAEGVRPWCTVGVNTHSFIAVYSENRWVRSAWESLVAGDVVAQYGATFALGERAAVRCVWVDEYGGVTQDHIVSVSFIKFYTAEK